MALSDHLLHELLTLPEVVVYGTTDIQKKIPVVSFNIKNRLPQEVAHELNQQFDIAVRAGLHCAPLMHRKLQTIPTGTIRASLSHLNSIQDVELLLHAIKTISK